MVLQLLVPLMLGRGQEAAAGSRALMLPQPAWVGLHNVNVTLPGGAVRGLGFDRQLFLSSQRRG